MKAVGIVVEYNPFHHGHELHIHEAKLHSGANIVIAVMSGNFLQRGEPAIVSKWTRATMALEAGVDIVLELPYSFATQRADMFAHGAVSVLTAIGCEFLCFGSESGNIHEFETTYRFLTRHEKRVQTEIKEQLQTGISYPKAVANAIQSVPGAKGMVFLEKPNNMLGYQYIAAIKQQNSPLKPLTIKRKHAQYHDETLSTGKIASATSIRKHMLTAEGENLSSIQPYVPVTTFQNLLAYKRAYGQFHHWEDYWPLLQYKLIQMDQKQLHSIYEMEEGLENRFLSAVETATSFQQLIMKVKTKRYTWTRLQRAAVHMLTNTTKAEMNSSTDKATYLRLLGFSQQGRQYLNKIKHHLSIPLVANLASFPAEKIELDVRATKIYSLGLKGKAKAKLLKSEYSTPPIYMRRE